MMLRCTSAVPPPIVRALANRYPLTHASDGHLVPVAVFESVPDPAPATISPDRLGADRPALVEPASSFRSPSAGPASASMLHTPARSMASSMTRWPWSSARAFLTDASGPGARPDSVAPTVRRQMSRRISPSAHTRAKRSRSCGSFVPAFADEIDQVLRSRSLSPQRSFTGQRDALVAQRDLGEGPTLVHVSHEIGAR